jgi:AcrR family transcriptional regulator
MSQRAASVADTGDRILDATLARFAALPYDRIRLEDVATDAGVSLQTVLRRFRSKAGLICSMATRELGRIAETREQHEGASPARVVTDLVVHYERYGDLILKVYAEAGQVEGLAEIAHRGRAYHVRWCEQAFARSLQQVPEIEARRRRRAQLVALCDATTWRILRHDAGLDSEQIERALLELVLPLCATDRADGSDGSDCSGDSDGSDDWGSTGGRSPAGT